MHPLATVVSVN
uniref:Uncharacterized protein n=1 Tax=Arundo donax TaxID=35708 RepID=A0A0A8XWL7_ARUDO